jgi:hypothetical protein
LEPGDRGGVPELLSVWLLSLLSLLPREGGEVESNWLKVPAAKAREYRLLLSSLARCLGWAS